MNSSRFPTPFTDHPEGLVAISDFMNVDLLIDAYENGIFPWPMQNMKEIPWFSPNPRGVIFFKQFHLSKSLQKFIKKNKFEIRFNNNFENVLKLCSQYHKEKNKGTWLNKALIQNYTQLFHLGLCYSVEAYLEERLVGAIYGVKMNKYLSAESMFSLEDNAAKVCLYSLINHFKNNSDWIDIQMVTPFTKSMGGEYISREDFFKLLKKSLH
jgi:leucyl/phenylalanyl-tRNA--protein transferase